jgi:hypothetical protein
MKCRSQKLSHGESARTRHPGPPLIQEDSSFWDIEAMGRFWDGALDRFKAYLEAQEHSGERPTRLRRVRELRANRKT